MIRQQKPLDAAEVTTFTFQKKGLCLPSFTSILEFIHVTYFV